MNTQAQEEIENYYFHLFIYQSSAVAHALRNSW